MPNCFAIVGPPLCAIHHVELDGRYTEMSVLVSPSKSNGALLKGAWFTLITCDPTLIVPARGCRVIFGCTVKVSAPLPLCCGEVTCIQLAVVVPCHAHDPPVETATFPVPPV